MDLHFARYIAMSASTEKQPSGDEALEARIAELERFCEQLSLEKDEAWVSDITYVRLPGEAGFCYLAATLDAYSRRSDGWRLSRQIDTSLTLSALEMARRLRQGVLLALLPQPFAG